MRVPLPPIAIVGQGCVLPGATSPEALIDDVIAGTDRVRPVPEGRWGLDPEVAAKGGKGGTDRSVSDAGGYVEGFALDTTGLPAATAAFLPKLDPLFGWVLHSSREALRSAGMPDGAERDEKVGLILGNLSFPTQGMAHFGAHAYFQAADAPWAAQGLAEELGVPAGEPLDRFMSGLPAHLTASALGLTAGAYCLDAACASSLYAVRLAVDRLLRGEADVMLAGAVNRADNLFLHVGFTALQALSPTGQSRPFHKGANGLVPGEGAGVVALMTLDKALAHGRRVLGVIRGAGLSNDGRGRNLLAPSSEGQVRAIRYAWEQTGVDPTTVGMLECHATGTPMGDKTEVESLATVFAEAGSRSIGLGSLKSNLGHLITGAGIAGMIKVLGSIAKKTLPPTLHVDDPIDVLVGDKTPFRLLTEAEPWDHQASHPRRAGVSAFGFGGNNAHVVIEEWTGDESLAVAPPKVAAQKLDVVGLGARSSMAACAADLCAVLDEGRPVRGALEASASLAGLRFPPVDLKSALPQQIMVFEAAREALADAGAEVVPERTAILVGMGADSDVTSPGARWRLLQWGHSLDEERLESLREQTSPAITAQGVLGRMPNIPANRLNAQLDVRGPGFTVSGEELSGLVALDIARDLLRDGEVDTVIVGAVDVFTDVRDRAAADYVGAAGRRLGDGAVALVVVREGEGDQPLARIDDVKVESASPVAARPRSEGARAVAGLDEDPAGATPAAAERVLGHAHAASGLLEVAAAVLDLGRGKSADPTSVEVGAIGQAAGAVRLSPASVRAEWPTPRPSPAPVVSVPMHHPVPKVAPPMDPSSRSPNPSSPNTMPAAPRLSVVEAAPFRLPAPPAQGSMDPAPLLTGDRAPGRAPAAPEPAAPAPAQPDTARMEPTSVPTPVASPAPAASTPAHPPLPEPEILGAAPDAGASPWSALSDARADLAGMHQSYLEQATRTQRAFLEHRQQLNSRLSSLVSQGIEPSAAPASFPLSRERESGPGGEGSFQAPAPTSDGLHAVRLADAEIPIGGIDQAPTFAPPRPPPAAPATYVGEPPAPLDFSTPEGKQQVLELRQNPWIDWNNLRHLAGGRISDVLGPMFKQQDGFVRQVRMPEPPLLLCDRVLTSDAQLGVLEPNKTMWTETDVDRDKWYLHLGRIPPGVLIESGQADLLLISMMGVDWANKGERVYRLLGCDLTYRGPMPEVGSVLHFDIHIDGFANHGDTRLFFFHSDCRVGGPDGPIVLSVRGGQAGFFSDAELDESGGILWKPTDEDPATFGGRVDPPRVSLPKQSFDRSELEAIASGDVVRAFGEGWKATAAHVRTPSLQGGDMLLLDRVTHLDPSGGPWGKGYFRAEYDLYPERWFFDGHFKDDPCMPGTLMFEGCLQCMDLYLMAMGFTLDKDGFRFEPVPEKTFPLRCRGQATPKSRHMVYELFIKEVRDEREPSVRADILVTVDGLKGLYAKDIEVRLVADFPLASHPELTGDRQKASGVDGVGGVPDLGQPEKPSLYNQRQLLASAWGKPSEAFGPAFSRFDGPFRAPRLPGPPYHCMTRVTEVTGPEAASFKPGNSVEVEYDVPPDAWYFHEHGAAVMPFSILLETALQPCGWLATYAGSTLQTDEELFFRNLDGDGVCYRALGPDSGTVTTRATLNKISNAGGMIIQEFDVAMRCGAGPVFECKTSFGFFPERSLAQQAGVGSTDADKAALVEPCAPPAGMSLPLSFSPGGSPLPIGGGKLQLLDHVTGWWPTGGSAGLGRVRAEKDIRGDEWFFKAHFFQDPVQPGSLGLEAVLQAAQWAARKTGRYEGRADAVPLPLPLGEKISWRYRGQVLPKNKKVVVEVDLLELRDDAVICEAWLWVDGLRIYHAPRIGIGID